MGVPYYFLHIIKKYPNIIRKTQNLNIQNLYLDSNSIIYDVYNSINSNDYETLELFINDIYEKVCKKIDDLIKELNPKNKIYITFDGVAPVAKLKHQRTRRFKSNFTKIFCLFASLSCLPEALTYKLALFFHDTFPPDP